MRGKATSKRRILLLLSTLMLVFVACYLGISAYITGSVLHPVRLSLHTDPSQYGLKYENVQFTGTVDGITLKGWYIDSPGSRVVMMLHGENSIRDNYIMMEVSRALYTHGYDVLMFDFRGHGQSGGEVGSLGQWETRDVAGALLYLRQRGVTSVGVLGYSMGAATALLAAPDHPEMAAIVADSSFADLFTIMDRQREQRGLPSFFNPGILLISRVFYGLDLLNNHPASAIAQAGNRPILLIQSSQDAIIPVSEAYKLKSAGSHDPNLQLWVAQSPGHVGAFGANKQEYLSRVIGFYDTYLP